METKLRCELCREYLKQDGGDAIEFLFGPFTVDLKPMPYKSYVHANCYTSVRLGASINFPAKTLEDVFGVI